MDTIEIDQLSFKNEYETNFSIDFLAIENDNMDMAIEYDDMVVENAFPTSIQSYESNNFSLFFDDYPFEPSELRLLSESKLFDDDQVDTEIRKNVSKITTEKEIDDYKESYRRMKSLKYRNFVRPRLNFKKKKITVERLQIIANNRSRKHGRFVKNESSNETE